MIPDMSCGDQGCSKISELECRFGAADRLCRFHDHILRVQRGEVVEQLDGEA
jgi:hypothetical protein